MEEVRAVAARGRGRLRQRQGQAARAEGALARAGLCCRRCCRRRRRGRRCSRGCRLPPTRAPPRARRRARAGGERGGARGAQGRLGRQADLLRPALRGRQDPGHVRRAVSARRGPPESMFEGERAPAARGRLRCVRRGGRARRAASAAQRNQRRPRARGGVGAWGAAHGARATAPHARGGRGPAGRRQAAGGAAAAGRSSGAGCSPASRRCVCRARGRQLRAGGRRSWPRPPAERLVSSARPDHSSRFTPLVSSHPPRAATSPPSSWPTSSA